MHKWKPMVLQFKKRLKMTAPAFFSRIRFLTTFSLSHFRQLGNQKETLMVEIPTVASPSRLFGVLYQQHLSKIF